MIMRTLRENNDHFIRKDRNIIPITGFSCWALGYIDKDYKRVGCLLHPAQNMGKDLRYRIDYGEKCRRESCREEKIFSLLKEAEQQFWLQLSDGLDSFAYSSRVNNPLFVMLNWGVDILREISKKEKGKRFTRELFFRSYPFFKTGLSPRRNAYILNQLAAKEGVSLFTREDSREKIEALSSLIKTRFIHEYRPSKDGPHTHLLTIDPLFSDFLRLSLGITRIGLDDAVAIKRKIDDEIEAFQKDRNG